MTTTERRVIVAGAGCAGLAVASALDRELPGEWEIVIVDAHFDLVHSKTWCFWGELPAQLSPSIVSHRWSRAAFRAPGFERVDTLHRNRYHRVDQAAYRSHHLQRLRASSRVRWVQDAIKAVYNTSDQTACVETGSGRWVARWVFQSVIRPEPTRIAQTRLLQHFGGWEVRTSEPVFDPGTFTLMDFSVEQRGAVAFRYVLPTAPDRALVEHTVFSHRTLPKEDYDGELRRHLRSITRSFEVMRTEYGAIPMQDERLPQRTGPCVFNLGTVGGLTKPTTGYTFLRIQQQADRLVRGLVHTGVPQTLPDAPGRFGWYDRLLLQILARTPARGPEIFTRLFQRQPTETILSFLDERSTPLEEARLFWGLPWAPFLAAAVRGRAPARLALTAGGVT